MGKKTLIEKESPEELQELEQLVYEALLERGWIIPQSEGDVSRAEARMAMEDHEKPPRELCDPAVVLSQSQTESGTVTALQPADLETSELLARAARAGKDIPAEVDERMRRDREMAERTA